jgi:hypothetical protein
MKSHIPRLPLAGWIMHTAVLGSLFAAAVLIALRVI